MVGSSDTGFCVVGSSEMGCCVVGISPIFDGVSVGKPAYSDSEKEIECPLQVILLERCQL